MKHLLFALTIAAISLTSCKKEPVPAPSGYQHSFKNQDLQGKIEGEAWSIKSGFTTEIQGEQSSFSFNLYRDIATDICFSFERPATDQVLFFMDDFKIGLSKLSLEGQTITLFDSETSLNSVATEGAIEILSIDTVNNVITGRMDVKADDQNFINGNFSINYCR